MASWIYEPGSYRQFAGGHEDWAEAARIAGACSGFSLDVEDEQVADELRSCYNCRFRRWTAASFVCLNPPHVDRCTP